MKNLKIKGKLYNTIQAMHTEMHAKLGKAKENKDELMEAIILSYCQALRFSMDCIYKTKFLEVKEN